MDQGLRICMFSNLLPPPSTGSSTFTWELSRRLAKRGHHVVVVTAQMEGAPRNEEKENVQIYRLSAIRLPRMSIAHNFKWMTYTFTPGNLRGLRGLFERQRFNIIHQQNHIFDTILSSPRLARRYRLPLVLTIHTVAQHTNPFLNRVLALFDALARKVIFENADVIVSPDPVMREYVEMRHGIDDSLIIPYGIEVPDPRSEDVAELRRRFKLGEIPVILSLGHVHKLRDRMDLIQAMPVILRKFQTARLLIVGEMQIQEPVELVNKLGLRENVTFAGALPHTQVPALFALSMLETHTFASDYAGPGIASTEAMAAGLPVVTGEIDSRYDFKHFRNWENVVMVPRDQPEVMADAIMRLLNDRGLREHIGANARRMMAERYSWDSICNAYVALYRRTIQQCSPSGAGRVLASRRAVRYG